MIHYTLSSTIDVLAGVWALSQPSEYSGWSLAMKKDDTWHPDKSHFSQSRSRRLQFTSRTHHCFRHASSISRCIIHFRAPFHYSPPPVLQSTLDVKTTCVIHLQGRRCNCMWLLRECNAFHFIRSYVLVCSICLLFLYVQASCSVRKLELNITLRGKE